MTTKGGFVWRLFKFLGYVLVAIALVIVVFSWTVDTFVENADAHTAAPKNTEWVTVGNNEIAYQHFPADGETVVLIGGTTAWSGVWKNTIEDLQEYDMYAIDMPPFGYSIVDPRYKYDLASQAQLINDYIEALKLGRVVLVAHSYGAGPSMEAVLQEPTNYKKFVIVDGAIHVDRKAGKSVGLGQRIFSVSTLRYALTSVAMHVPGFIEASIKYLTYDNSKVTDFWVDIYSRPLTVEDQSHKIAKWLYDFAFENGTGLSSDGANYESLQTPVLIIWGREDNLTPLEQGEYLHHIIPNSEIHIMEKTGHMPMIDNLTVFDSTLLEFLRR